MCERFRPVVHALPDDVEPAERLADALGARLCLMGRHRFPDGESMVALGGEPGEVALIFSGLHSPEGKLFGVLQAAQAASLGGARRVALVAPYLPYLRQDSAFAQGQPVSAQLLGSLLGRHFDLICTVDPHLHRVDSLDALVGQGRGLRVSASAALGALARAHHPEAVLLGPDEESEQWVAEAAGPWSRWQIARKVRRGDTEVEVTLPDPDGLRGQAVVIVDDILSSGRTVARCAEAALRAGAARVSCAVTHGLFAGDALEHVQAAGVSQIWCADAVPHPLNALPLAPLLAAALRDALAL